jgi:hypothetical protein
MPDIMVEVGGSWLAGRQTAVVKAVHESVVQTLKTPITSHWPAHRASAQLLFDAAFRG